MPMNGGPVQYQADPVANTNHSRTRAPRFVHLYNGSGSALAAGDCVAVDYTSTAVPKGTAIKKSPTAAAAGDDGQCIGAAHRAIPNGEWGPVQVEGYDADVASESDLSTVGDLAVQSISTAGRLQKQADLDGNAYTSAKLLVIAHVDVVVSSNVVGVTWHGNMGY